MLAAINNWLPLLFIALAVIFRLLTKAAGAKPDSSEPDESTFPRPDQPAPRTQPMSDEEQIRKFLEALGQPRTAKPPPPVAPRTDVSPRPVAPVQPPQTMIPSIRRAVTETQKKTQPSQPSRQPVPPPLPRRYEPRPSGPTVAPAPTFEVQETAAPQPEATPAAVPEVGQPLARTSATDQQRQRSILDLLRSGRGLREAVILREILGPPRGVEPFELSSAA